FVVRMAARFAVEIPGAIHTAGDKTGPAVGGNGGIASAAEGGFAVDFRAAEPRFLLGYFGGIRARGYQRVRHSCAARADFPLLRAPSRNLCGHPDFFRGSAGCKLPFARRVIGGGKCGISLATIVERDGSVCDLDSD